MDDFNNRIEFLRNKLEKLGKISNSLNFNVIIELDNTPIEESNIINFGESIRTPRYPLEYLKEVLKTPDKVKFKVHDYDGKTDLDILDINKLTAIKILNSLELVNYVGPSLKRNSLTADVYYKDVVLNGTAKSLYIKYYINDMKNLMIISFHPMYF